ncbi:Uncharacterised protein [Mycobacteroides abscessus subsp. abscessus]|nr:Uncharacterised protein [Mycobacteroides abscessus subsp. abscessus]
MSTGDTVTDLDNCTYITHLNFRLIVFDLLFYQRTDFFSFDAHEFHPYL